MLRPVSLLPALVAVAASASWLLGATAVPAAAAEAAHGSAQRALHRAAEDATPLAVTIDTLSSSTIPEHGPLQVTGTVTNRDTEAWTTVNLYAFLSDSPITSTADLAEAAQSPSSVEVGSRLIHLDDPATFETVDVLEPGTSAPFSITVRHEDLDVTAEGVYWFGVHALGAGPEGRVDGADGRARTFLPYVAPRRHSVDTALVVPVRRQITHAADGSLTGVPAWTKTLSSGGALNSLVDVGAAAGPRSITWLVDPAVVDAAERLAAGNPPRSLAPTPSDSDSGGGSSGDESPSADASPSPSGGGGGDGGSGGSGDETTAPSPAEAKAAAAAQDWLEDLHRALEGHPILSLPYGDVDVAAAAEHDPEAYTRARERSSGDLQPWGLPTSPVVSSPTGYIDEAGIRQTESSTPLLVSDRMFGPRAPSVAHTDGHTLAVASSGAVSGGPGPDERRSALAVRQRIVSEAALRVLVPSRKPLIAALPATWSPDSVTGFFEGLDLDWLNLTTLDQVVTGRVGTDVPLDRLDYPDTQQRLEVDATTFAATDELAGAGDVLQNLLTRNTAVGDEVEDEALTDTGYSTRLHPALARLSAERSRRWIERRLRGVRIDAPKAVILSSGSGRFAATVTNTLDEPVSVKIRATAEQPLEVNVPRDTVDLGPDSRTTVLLNASSTGLGIGNVTLVLTDTEGAPLGSADALPVRSNQLSNVIWLIIGTGVALLFGAIAVRLVRRLRAAPR